MNKLQKVLGLLAFGAMVGAGSYAYNSRAEEPPPEQTTTTTTTETTTTTAEEPRETISYEYYTITEEAVKNGWTCHTVDRCDSVDSNRIYVYTYDPAIIGKHKFNVVTGVDILQIDFTVVYVNEYNDVLGTETFTLTSNSLRGFVLEIDTYPPGTKYVKFADITNIVYPE